MSKNYDKLLRYALRILIKKRYTCNGIIKKLEQYSKKWKLYDEEDEKKEIIDLVLSRLTELKYLDDRQYLQDYVSERIKFKPRGQFLLKRELLLKGFPMKFIEEHFAQIEIDEYDLAKRALLKRLRQLEKYPLAKRKNKSFSFLASRGFSPDAIYKAIDYHYSLSVNEDL